MTFPVEVTGEPWTGNVQPLLYEVYHALKRLLETGEVTVIDLRALPLAPGEEAKIEQKLGTGEVHARIDALEGPCILSAGKVDPSCVEDFANQIHGSAFLAMTEWATMDIIGPCLMIRDAAQISTKVVLRVGAWAFQSDMGGGSGAAEVALLTT